jgi:catechol 2,3-dioxygenase-like lactoylglutathione lyase family enzyme
MAIYQQLAHSGATRARVRTTPHSLDCRSAEVILKRASSRLTQAFQSFDLPSNTNPAICFAMEKAMLPSPVIDLKAFVPAKDPALSRAFYTDLGFTINSGNDEIAELQMGAFRFLLQKFYVADHAGNFMMSLGVEDVDAWWEYIQHKEFAKKYPGIMCKPPEMQPWGIRVLYLSDPTGVLWHIAERPKS